MKTLANLLLLLLPLGGCALLVGAAVGAGIVHTTGDDSAELSVRNSAEEVFDACQAELLTRGTVEQSDVEAGRLAGEIAGTDLEITIRSVEQDLRHIEVEARRNAGVTPDPDTASEFLRGVLLRLP